MKQLQLLVILLFMLLHPTCFANKILITGNPAYLEKQGDVYSLPNNYKMTKSYYYVVVNGSKKVCYLEKQPNLSVLNTEMLNVSIRNSVMDLVCYVFDPNYFETP